MLNSGGWSLSSSNHFIRPRQYFDWNCQTNLFCRLEVNDDFKLRRLLHGQIAGLCALKNLVYVVGSLAEQVRSVRAIGHEATLINKLLLEVNCRQAMFDGK